MRGEQALGQTEDVDMCSSMTDLIKFDMKNVENKRTMLPICP